MIFHYKQLEGVWMQIEFEYKYNAIMINVTIFLAFVWKKK